MKCGLTRGRTRRGPASARRPSRLVKSKTARRRAACIARLTCRQAVRRAAVATRALAARVNLWTVRRTSIPTTARSPTRPDAVFLLILFQRELDADKAELVRCVILP